MRNLTIVSLCLSCASLLSACGADAVTATTPTKTDAMQSASVTVSPSTLTAQAVPNPFCPSVAPYALHFTVAVSAGSSAVTVTTIAVRFTDATGIQMPQVTLPAPSPLTSPIPTTQFGTALLDSRSMGPFPVDLAIGCGTSHDGTLLVLVSTVDRAGNVRTLAATAPVR